MLIAANRLVTLIAKWRMMPAVREIDTAKVWPYIFHMPSTTIKSTYSLDVESVRKLEALAQRWKVSKTEVLRRAIRRADMERGAGDGAPLGALDRLQTSLREGRVDVKRWARDSKAERRAASLQLSSKSQ